MIIKMRRVYLHPWDLFFVFQPAVNRHPAKNEHSRRVAASVRRSIRAAFDPDDVHFANPYALVSSEARREVEARNAVVGRGHADFRPLPNPEHRVKVELTEDGYRFATEAARAYMEAPDVSNEVAENICDVVDALAHCELVEVDTDKAGS